MVVAAFVVAIVSAAISAASVLYARRAAAAADRSAGSAAITAGLDADRRHAELTPRLRIRCGPANPGVEATNMSIYLAGPPELERLDRLVVVIRDANPWRDQGTPLAGDPTPEQVAAHVWGRYKLTPGAGPGVDPATGLFGADRTGRRCPTGGMLVGERLLFQLDPTLPPSWSHQSLESWQQQVGPLLRLRLECHREGQAPWILPCEVLVEDGEGSADVPEQSSP